MNMHSIFPQKPETGPPATVLTDDDLSLIATYFDYPEFVPQAVDGDAESLRYVAVELTTLVREALTDANARKLLHRLAQLGIPEAARHLSL